MAEEGSPPGTNAAIFAFKRKTKVNLWLGGKEISVTDKVNSNDELEKYATKEVIIHLWDTAKAKHPKSDGAEREEKGRGCTQRS